MQSDVKLISVNIGLPRVVMSNGDPVSTGIFKEPVAGRVMLRTLNLDGDRQADLSVHGGPSKAVYVYPSEHYGDASGKLEELFPASTCEANGALTALTHACRPDARLS